MLSKIEQSGALRCAGRRLLGAGRQGRRHSVCSKQGSRPCADEEHACILCLHPSHLPPMRPQPPTIPWQERGCSTYDCTGTWYSSTRTPIPQPPTAIPWQERGCSTYDCTGTWYSNNIGTLYWYWYSNHNTQPPTAIPWQERGCSTYDCTGTWYSSTRTPSRQPPSPGRSEDAALTTVLVLGT